MVNQVSFYKIVEIILLKIKQERVSNKLNEMTLFANDFCLCN